MSKQIFGVIVSTRSFFPSSLVADARKTIAEVLAGLGHDCVMVGETDTGHGAILSFDEAKVCVELFRKNRDVIDGIIVVLPNFGEELGVAEAIDLAGLDVPVLVQACDDAMDNLDMAHRRDAFCGKLSVCNNLYQRGIKYSTTTLHTCDIDSLEFRRDLGDFAAVCRIVRGMKGARIAAIGARPVAFNTVRYSEKILQRHHISVQTVDLSEVIFEAANMAPNDSIQGKIEEIQAYGSIPIGYEAKVEKQARLCLALEAKVDNLQCDASSVQCWDSIENNYGCATCLAMSMMGEKGKPSACESDVMGAVTMLALQNASGAPPAYMDWNNNIDKDRDACITLHCANFPKSFFGTDDIEIENLDVLGSTIGQDKCFGACKGQVAPGPMTFAKITTDDTRGVMKLYVGEGQFTDTPVPTKGGVAACQVDDLQSLMRYICKNGYEHHVCFARGHFASAIQEAFENYLGVEVYRHNA